VNSLIVIFLKRFLICAILLLLLHLIDYLVLSVCFRPDGKAIACSTLDAQIVIININDTDQQAVIGTIECKHDLGYSRKETDKVTAKKLQFGK
jgi:hypothetical protein